MQLCAVECRVACSSCHPVAHIACNSTFVLDTALYPVRKLLLRNVISHAAVAIAWPNFVRKDGDRILFVGRVERACPSVAKPRHKSVTNQGREAFHPRSP